MKNFIARIQKLPGILFLITILSITASLASSAMQPMGIATPQPPAGASNPGQPGAPGMPELSPEDLKMFEDAMKMVDEHVKALPTRDQLRAQGVPEEQVLKAETREKFDEEVARYSKMSEKELLEEIEKAFSEINQAPPAAPQTPAQPAYEPYRPVQMQPENKKEEAPLVAIPTNKQQAALQLLDQTIKSINSFLRKTEMIVELPSKVQSWTRQGKLRNWPTSLSWNSLKLQIQELEVKLLKIKDLQTPGGTNYKYLDEFIKDESLYNNVTRLKDSLVRNEPTVQIGGFGIEKMSSPARKATRAVLTALVEATTVMALPTSLDKIIEKFEPTAKKMRETEEASRKQAFEQSKRPRVSGSVTSTPPQREKPSVRFPESSPRQGGSSSNTPSFSGDASNKRLTDEPKKPAGGAGAEAAKKLEEPKKPEDKKTDKDAANYANNFRAALDTIRESKEKFFDKLENHMLDDSFVNPDYTQGFKATYDAANKAENALGNMKKKLPRLSDAQKKEYKAELKDAFKEEKSTFSAIDKSLSSVQNPGKLSLVKSSSNPIYTNAKYYAYFGKNKDALEKSLDDLNKNLFDLRAISPAPSNFNLKEKALKRDITRIEDLLLQDKPLTNIAELKEKLIKIQRDLETL